MNKYRSLFVIVLTLGILLLTVQPALAAGPTATTGLATGTTTTGATLNGMVNANGQSATVTFEYGLTTSYGSTVTAAPSPVSGSVDTPVSAVISGLTPNTIYHFRVKAANAGGTTTGSDVDFATDATPPPSTPFEAWGTVTVDGVSITTGTIVGRISGLPDFTAIWESASGTTYYDLTIPADDPETPGVKDGGQPGDHIDFYVAGLKATQSATWGQVIDNIDLTAFTPPGDFAKSSPANG